MLNVSDAGTTSGSAHRLMERSRAGLGLMKPGLNSLRHGHGVLFALCTYLRVYKRCYGVDRDFCCRLY